MKSRGKLVPDLGPGFGSPWAPCLGGDSVPWRLCRMAAREDPCWTRMDGKALPGMTGAGGALVIGVRGLRLNPSLVGKVQTPLGTSVLLGKMGCSNRILAYRTGVGGTHPPIGRPPSSGNSRARQQSPEPKRFLPPGGTILAQATELQAMAKVSFLPSLPSLSLFLTQLPEGSCEILIGSCLIYPHYDLSLCPTLLE